MSIINKNINDIYQIIISPEYIKNIYKPEKIIDDIIINKYDILQFDDIPNELKVLFNTYIIIHTKQKIIKNEDEIILKHNSELINDLSDLNQILKFDIIYKKKDNNTTIIDYKFYDINEDNNNINPIYIILYMILNNYIDNVLIPNIKSKYLIKINNLLHIMLG